MTFPLVVMIMMDARFKSRRDKGEDLLCPKLTGSFLLNDVAITSHAIFKRFRDE